MVKINFLKVKKSSKKKKGESNSNSSEVENKSSKAKNNISIQQANVYGGESYQAGRDIYINKVSNEAKNERKKKWEKLYYILASIVAIITILKFVFGIPQCNNLRNSEFNTHFIGFVTDIQNQTPILGAKLTIDALPGDTVISTSDGNFAFDSIPRNNNARIKVSVLAKGYKFKSDYYTLGKPADIRLEKIKK